MVVNKLLTKVNFTKQKSPRKIKYIVIHYVGATGGARNNCIYYENVYRGASAHYFIGHANENASIWQCVEDNDVAWHCGAKKYYHNECRNSNSIGIELCCHKDSKGNWYFDKETLDMAVEFVKEKMKEYHIPIENVVRHYDVTHKICPKPFVDSEKDWINFKRRLTMKEFTDAKEALEYLIKKGRISDKDYWLKTLDVVKQQEWIFIKWANDVMKVE